MAWLASVFADTSEIMYMATQPSEFYSFVFLGRHRNGERLSYEIPTEPGCLDGARAPYDPGGAEAYNVD